MSERHKPNIGSGCNPRQRQGLLTSEVIVDGPVPGFYYPPSASGRIGISSYVTSCRDTLGGGISFAIVLKLWCHTRYWATRCLQRGVLRANTGRHPRI